MSNIVSNSLNINTFFKNIKLTQTYMNKLKTQVLDLKNYYEISKYENLLQNVAYIVYIIQNRTNLVMHITTSQGNLIFSLNACAVGFSGKLKQKAQASVVKKFVEVLISSRQLIFLRNKPVALHLKNIGIVQKWAIKNLKNHFFIESLNFFSTVLFNGCRQKKLRRKKVKKKK